MPFTRFFVEVNDGKCHNKKWIPSCAAWGKTGSILVTDGEKNLDKINIFVAAIRQRFFLGSEFKYELYKANDSNKYWI